MIIGLDFDNTIVDYDAVFSRVAVALGLVGEGEAVGKAAVRATLRRRPGGEQDWQRLQGQVYGRFMAQAEIMPGLEDFLRAALERGFTLTIISHKTRFGHFDESRTNLRRAALEWMNAKGFFSPDGFVFDPGAIHFEDTRAEKVARIAELAPDLFIDDLSEVFAEPHFPLATRRILYTYGASAEPGDYEPCGSWADIRNLVLNA